MCRGELVEKQDRKIVLQYEETVDIAEEPVGQLNKLVAPYLTTVKKSLELKDPDLRAPFDLDRLANERVLYNALRNRREDILKRKLRPPC